jgi:hypothetical protein
MKVLVKYTSLAVDNYQGGSGKVIENQAIVDLKDGLPISEVWEDCLATIDNFNKTDENLIIREISILKTE